MKLPGSEADHSPPSSAEVKNAWSYTSTHQYAFMAWGLVKAQGQLYLAFVNYVGCIDAVTTVILVGERNS
jgi:hypothetical protein